MAKTHFIRFTIRHQKDDLIFEVRAKDSDRVQNILDDSVDHNPGFLCFHTITGLCVVINPRDVQAIRFLWDVVAATPDLKRSEGGIEIQLRGRSTILEVRPQDPVQVFDLIRNFESSPEVIAFPRFTDEDGEQLQLNAAEVVWVTAPTHLFDEGECLLLEQDVS